MNMHVKRPDKSFEMLWLCSPNRQQLQRRMMTRATLIQFSMRKRPWNYPPRYMTASQWQSPSSIQSTRPRHRRHTTTRLPPTSTMCQLHNHGNSSPWQPWVHHNPWQRPCSWVAFLSGRPFSPAVWWPKPVAIQQRRRYPLSYESISPPTRIPQSFLGDRLLARWKLPALWK